MRQACWAAGWAYAVFLVAFSVAERTGAGDHVRPAIWLATFAPGVLASALTLAGVAAWRHRRALAVTATVAALGGLWLVWPALPMPGGPSGPTAGPTFTLATMNAFKGNDQPRALVEGALATAPDVLLVQEYGVETRHAFQQSPAVAAQWPYFVQAGDGGAGMAVFSRLPILDSRTAVLGNPALVVHIAVGDEVVTVVDLHAASAGRHSSASQWRDSLGAVADLAATIEGPLVLAGDYNATVYHKPFRDLLDGPLHDAHQDLDRAFDLTWGPAWPGFPPVALIDHVVLSPEVRALRIDDHHVAGSDHRMVTVELRVGAGTTPGEHE